MASRRSVSEGGPKENHSTEEEGGEERKKQEVHIRAYDSSLANGICFVFRDTCVMSHGMSINLNLRILLIRAQQSFSN